MTEQIAVLLKRELDAIVLDPADDALPTRCPPWTVGDIYKHLSATFYRYNELLRRAREGRMDPPFGPDDLPRENLRAVEGFPPDLDARRSMCEQASRWIAMASDPAELMPSHQGVRTVDIQMRLGLADVVIHHDDIAVADGRTYRAPDEVCVALLPAWEAIGRGAPDTPDLWGWILRASGR